MKIKSLPFYILAALSIGSAGAVLVFIIYTLLLRTEYRNTAFEINYAILASSDYFLGQNGTEYAAELSDIDFYNRFLLEDDTFAYSRKPAALTDSSIILKIGDSQLSFTKLEDGSAISIRWENNGRIKSYRVRSSIFFTHLQSYFKNFARKQEA